MSDISETQRVHLERIVKVMIIIEEHIDEDLSLAELAKRAHFSPYHFHRIFSAYTGEPLSAYIRRLRLERAAWRLKYGHMDVTHVALDAGFETPSAFSKAFRQQMGTSPTEFRRSESRWWEQTIEQIKKLNEEKMMNVEFVNLDPMDVYFIRRTGDYNTSAPKAWTALMTLLGKKRVKTDPALKYWGIGHDDPSITAEDKVRYDACCSATAGLEPEGELGKQVIPGGRHAVFMHKGAYETMGDTYDLIYAKWLPESGEQLADRPCVQEFVTRPADEQIPESEWETKIYVPLKN